MPYSRPPVYLFFIALLVWLLSSPLAFASVSAEPLPIDHFVRKGDYLHIKISPDGQHFAALVRQDDTVFLLVTRLSDGEIVGGVKPGENNEVSSVIWANSKRLIYTFAEKHYDRDGASNTGELYAVDFNSKNNKMLAGYRATDKEFGSRFKSVDNALSTHQVLNVLPSDERHILIIEYPWTKSGRHWYDRRELKPIVSKLDIYTGRKLERETLPYAGATALASDNGDVNFISWSTDLIDQQSALRGSKKEPWKNVSSVFGDNKQKFVAVEINDAGTKVYFKALIGKDRRKTLYEFDLLSKEMQRVFENKNHLTYWTYDNEGEPFVAMSYPNKEHYDYTVLKPDSPDIKRHKMLLKAFGGQEIQIRTQSLDGTRLIVRVNSSVNPGEYYLFNTVTKKADFIFANLSWIDPRSMVAKEPITLESRDGIPLNGYLTMPKGVIKNAPLLVLPHGGPHGVRDYNNFDSEVQMFANNGYAVLQINFRGSGGYGRTFSKLGYRQWGKAMINDVIDATHWAVKEGYADPQSLCIYGASYGGYSALMATVRAPDLFKCAIGYVGVYDLTVMKLKGDIPLGFLGGQYLDRVLGNDEADLTEQSPVTHADKIKASVMLIHGDNDIRVPSIHAKKMRNALKKAGNKAQWLYLGDVGHGARSEKNLKRVYTGIFTFLEKHIGASKPTQQ
mgnify:CR=1 FL=1